MKILILNVAASESGALSILNNFYKEVCENKDDIEWKFLLSTPEYTSNKKVEIKRFPWIKKSWFHRLYFDKFILKKEINDFNPDVIFSMQNICIKGIYTPQILYLHQLLPFTDIKYKLSKNWRFWIYQNILSKKIFESLHIAKKVIVQTEWMKEACVQQGIEKDKIAKVQPKIDFQPLNKNIIFNSKKFFYPATGFEYKNHKVIIDACEELENRNIKNYSVDFTLYKDENKYVAKLYHYIKERNLKINFIGKISKEKVMEKYGEGTLIFPSYIETFGLPLLEARLSNSIVLAATMPYCKEILNEYKNAYLFEKSDSFLLANLMQKVIECKIVKHNSADNYQFEANSIIDILLNY